MLCESLHRLRTVPLPLDKGGREKERKIEMDIVKALIDGGYNKDELSEKGKAFIEGMEYVLEEVLPTITFEKSDFEDCLSNTLKSIQIEIAENVIDLVKDVVRGEICDNVISLYEQGEVKAEV